jgi:hypothetical protein
MLLVNWKVLLLLLGLGLALVVGCVAYGAKQHVVLRGTAKDVRLLLPPLWRQFARSHAQLAYGGRAVAELRTGPFEGPVVLFMNGPTEAICVYENDVSLEVLAFAMAKATPPRIGHPIVVRAAVEWRRLEGLELGSVIQRLHAMPKEEFARSSAPSLDLGIFQVFRSKRLIEERLAKTARAPKRNL